MTASAIVSKPLGVRILRAAAWISLGLSVLTFGIGALLGFDELAKIWLAIAVLLFLTAVTAFLGVRPTRAGMLSALVACTLMLFLPPFGTLLTFVIAIVASQTWPQLRDYYRIRRSA